MNYSEAIQFLYGRQLFGANFGLENTRKLAALAGDPQTASSTSPDGKLVEVIELKDHPFFVASQFHPEFQSKPHQPHPLVKAFIAAAHQYIQAALKFNSRENWKQKTRPVLSRAG